MASSTGSSASLPTQHDVFLNFCGEDTRHGFISHLRSALRQKSIRTFIDDELSIGEDISLAVLNAIEESMFAVVVFSKDYAFSRWCLDELAKIVECMHTRGLKVIPVFYHIDRSDVGKQTGTFADAFARHEARFKSNMETVQRWRDALNKAANLSGWATRDCRSESDIVDGIIDFIWKGLDKSRRSPPLTGLAGMSSLTTELQTLEEEEERSIYLVLMEGDALAFQGFKSSSHQQTNDQPKRQPVSGDREMHLVDSHDQLLQSTLQPGSYKKLYSFKHLVNGFSVHTTPSQASKLKGVPGVRLVERDRGARLMTTNTPQFLGLPQGVWTQEGGDRNAGDGIVIGFVDTGINPEHPSFAFDPTNPFTSNITHFRGACETGPRFPDSSCNGKIVSARFFSVGARARDPLNASEDFLSPFDAHGHGSHVASIAAGNAEVAVVVDGIHYGKASGMAPRARISVYKAVYPTVGVGTMTDVVAAIDKAAMDGVDILTLCVGPDVSPEDTLTFLGTFDILMLFAQRAGVFVVQAAGNNGPGHSTVVFPSPWAMCVAACSIDRSYPAYLQLGNNLKVRGVGLLGPTCGHGVVLYKLVLSRDAVKVNETFRRTRQDIEDCQYPEALDPNVVRGAIVISTFSARFYNGTSTLAAIIDTARTLGFAGFALVANPSDGDFFPQPIPFTMSPSTMSGIIIPKAADAEIVLQHYEDQIQRDERGFVAEFRAKATIREGRIASLGARTPTVSRYSSRGPVVDISGRPADVLKPDILAPGHEICAAWSPFTTSNPTGYSFVLQSGTSMAAAHVAGVAALIKQHNPSWTPSMISSAISTTATKYDNYGELIIAEGFDANIFYPSNYFDVGAGLVNPTRAIDPGLVLSSGFEDYISCRLTPSFPANLNLPSLTMSALRGSQTIRRTVINVGSKPEIYVCSVISPNGTIVSLSPMSFRLVPNGTQDLDIQLQVTQPLDQFSFGEIVLTGSLNHIVRMPISVLPISMS